ncbi:hypothetical protein HY641_05155, partial [Candidatus Woesearchaeota archaeon]|nr:hypothetical protein [Candidatus Woesearchaeota archaeon]
GLRIIDNLMLSTGSGISVTGAENPYLNNNTANATTSTTPAIALFNASSVVISNTTITNASHSIRLITSRATIRDVVIGNTSVGIIINDTLRPKGQYVIHNITYSTVFRESLTVSDTFNVSIQNTTLPFNVSIQNSTFARITYVGSGSPLDLDIATNRHLADFIFLSNRTARVNVSIATEFDRVADLRFNATGLALGTITESQHDPELDGIFFRCGVTVCTNLSTSGGFFTFNVSTWTAKTTYRVGDIFNVTNVTGGFNVTDAVDGNITFGLVEGPFQIRNRTGTRFFGANITGMLNLSQLNISGNGARIAVGGFAELRNISVVHSLYAINNNTATGVFVCPNVTTINQVVPVCIGAVNFRGPFPQTQAVDNDTVTINIDSGDYRADGLSHSGMGNLGASGAQISQAAGANITVSLIGTFNQSTHVNASTAGGNETALNLNLTFSSIKWQGYFGNATGSILIGAGENTLYNFGTATATMIAITQDPNFNFAAGRAANKTAVDRAFNFSENDTDSATGAFNDAGKNIGGISNVPFINLQNGTWHSGLFDNSSPTLVAPLGPSAYAFGVDTTFNGTNFLGSTSDFELITPIVRNQLTGGIATHYFFADIR